MAYNAIIHKNRFEIEEEIDDEIENISKKTGLFLTDNNESLPVFAPVGSCEKVFSRKESKFGDKTGARIVLTRDNFGHRATGLGGAGATKCEAIDIVAGSLSSAKELKTGKTQSRANFAEDGARIYLTERGDINAYFATAKSSSPGVHASSKMKSGIGIKSDHTLVIGRERVRILAGVSKYDGGERLVTGNKPSKPIVEIGATSSERHQKAVLGDNLVKYLKELNKTISSLNEKVASVEIDLLRFKFAMAHINTRRWCGSYCYCTRPSQCDSIIFRVCPNTLNTITTSIADEYNQIITELKYFGLPDIGIEGSECCKILSSTVYMESNMSESKFKILQKEVCDPNLEPPPLKKLCAPCVPNESYIEPDWEFVEIAEPYLNEKRCEYQVTVDVNKFGDSFNATEFRNAIGPESNNAFASREALLRSFVHPAIVLILEEYGKLVADQIICATLPGITGSSEEIVSQFDSFEGAFIKLSEQEIDQNRVRCEDYGTISATIDPTEEFDFQRKIIEVGSNKDVKNPFALELYARVNDFYIDPVGDTLKVHIGIPAFIIDQVPDLPSRQELEDEAVTTKIK